MPINESKSPKILIDKCSFGISCESGDLKDSGNSHDSRKSTENVLRNCMILIREASPSQNG